MNRGAVWLAAWALCACGPRTDAGSGSAVRNGSPPGIVDLDSQVPNPPDIGVSGANGELVTFPIRFIVRAVDPDQDMDRVLITVSYQDCDGVARDVELVYQIPNPERLLGDLTLDVVTDERVQVPVACYPPDNLFQVRVRVVDRHGNPSVNSVLDTLQIVASQGSTGNG
ncbi:MAG: hypothetical protein HZA24_08305 [Nitrospirae bacterium]|nr:hypothetical protein [Nitrospirota bacterium]